MDDADWIAPAEAEKLVAAHQGWGSLLVGEAKAQLLSWIGQDHLRTMALEVTRWEDEPTPSPPSLPPDFIDRSADDRGGEGDGLLPTYRVNPIYRPMSAWERPLVRSQSTDHAMTNQDWLDAVTAGVDEKGLWSASELTHRLTRQHHPNARVTYAGVRMSRADIERRIAIAGWSSPKCDDAEPKATDAMGNTDGRGRPRAEWWPDFVAELVAYTQELGLPDGIGHQGQSQILKEVSERLIERGKAPPERTQAQDTINAVLRRMRSAGK